MAKKLWGGRFGKPTDPLVEEFTKSIQYDYKLALYDAMGSMVHVKILKEAGYLTVGEASRLTKGLEAICRDIRQGAFAPDAASEDIHTDIQNKLEKKAGSAALKLHTARSRNDQVAFSTKLYCQFAILELKGDISKLTAALSGAGKKNSGVIIPGFTHMQHAQPVKLSVYLGAYVEMLNRDASRLDYIVKNLNIAMGAGAVSGTPIDAGIYKKFRVGPISNPPDTVSDRDFVIEILSALSLVGMHLSRLSEDLIIWSTKEFGFIDIDDSFSTGSSLMPQKKNPDVLELIRGYTGRLYGNLVSALTMMKGLPLAYNRDMQLDKEPLFDSFEIVSAELKVLEGLIKTLKFNRAKIEEHLKDESLYATDLVYYLVDKNVPFKEAHAAVGRLVKYSADNAIDIKEMPENFLKRFSGKFVRREVIKLFDPVVSVKSKRSFRR